MGVKPPDPDILSVHTYWDSAQGFKCPLCDSKLEYAFNDGGRLLVTLKGKLWVVTNYYRCLNLDCDLHKAFPKVHESAVKNKKFGKDVWERVVRYHFKYHLDYTQIQGLLWDDSDVSISKTTIKNMCSYFEKAGKKYMDRKVLSEIQAQGYMIISLDGAQPRKGDPALWIFTERLTQHTVKTKLLNTASSGILSKMLADIEVEYGVPIKAVISDKQKNIVNGVQKFNPEIPHGFCQYHFLNHIMEPIRAKDSNIATQVRKTIRSLSIVKNLAKSQLNPTDSEFNPLYLTLAPLAEELLNSIAVVGRKWEILPGKEIYENLLFILQNIESYIDDKLPHKILRSLKLVGKQIKTLLDTHGPKYNEIISLLNDSADLRKELSRKSNDAEVVKKAVKKWVYRIQSRLKRRGWDFKPEDLKYVLITHSTNLEIIWQEWVRLEWSYHKGLYYSYDFPEIEKTNNATEQLINRTKRHFKKWLGRQSYHEAFKAHGENYAHLVDLNLSSTLIEEILWKQSVAFGEGNNSRFEYYQPILKRNWRIRAQSTGNWERLMVNLNLLRPT